MNYEVHSPSPELQSFIKCFWTLQDKGEGEPARQRVIPDGCMEMIFHCGDLYRQYFEDGSSIIQPRSFIFGQIANYIEIAPTGITDLIAARFFPDGLSPFLPMHVIDLESKAVSLIEIFSKKGADLEMQVLSTKNTPQRIALIESFLLSLLADEAAVDAVVRNCVKVIFQSQGQIDVNDLSGKVNVHRRNMERRFTATIGLSPKQLAKVTRLQATLKMLQEKKFTSLTSLAHENGYYDQAHFIKDFREFTGMSPKSFFADNLKLSALFIAAG